MNTSISVLPELLQNLLNKIAIEEGFSDYDLISSPGSNHGDGFLGIIIRVIIKGTRNERPDELSLIVKTVPENQIRRDQFASNVFFAREIFVYDEFLPELDKFQKKKGLTPETGFFCYPKCYGTIVDHESYTYCLVLEDLKKSGYQMWNKFNVIELDQVELVVKHHAKLHAVSFAMRDQQPELMERFLQLTCTLLPLMKKEEFRLIMDTTYDKAIASLDPIKDESAILKMTELKKDSVKHYEFCLTRENSEPFVVISHGDSWTNNMMFSYTKANNKVNKVCFIDWQLCRASSPVLDFLYFFYTSTHKSFRDQHYEHVLKTYYNTLADSIRKLGSDPEKLFSFADLQANLKKFGKFALIISAMVIQTITTDPNDIPNLDEVTENMSKGDPNSWNFLNNNLDKFNIRSSDVIRDLLALKYF